MGIKVFRKLLKNLFPFFFAAFIPFKGYSADLEPLTIRNFDCGLVTSYDPTVIGEGCAQALWNVDIWTGRIQKRRGSSLINSTPLTGDQPVRFLKEFPDSSGNKWLIEASSDSLFKSNNGGAVNSVLTSTFGFTASSDFQGVNAFGKTRLTDGTTHWITFDGNTVAVSTASPRGLLAAFMFERVWTANVAGDNSELYASAYGDPEDWTDNGLADDDALSIPVRKNDGYPIRALIPFGNNLLVFKDRSIDAVTMDNSGLIPIIVSVSNNIGCAHPKSIQVRYNDVIFMGPDGFYSYMNGTITKISEVIKPTFDSVLQRNSTSRSLSLTTQSDFQPGTTVQTSLSVLPNSVVLSTWGITDDSASEFILGTLTDMSTTYVSAAIALSTSNTNVSNYSFETGTSAIPDNWTLVGLSTTTPSVPSGRQSYVTARTGTFALVLSSGNTSLNYYFDIVNSTGSVVFTSSYTYSGFGYVSNEVNLFAFRGQNIKFRLRDYNGGYALSDTFFCAGTTVTFYTNISGFQIIADDFSLGRSTIVSGSFTSQVFDTTISSPTWLATSVSTTTNGHAINFWTQVATSAAGVFDSSVSWTPGLSPASSTKRFIKYLIAVSTASDGTALPYISTVSLGARSISGSYQSAVQTIGSNINAWGTFTGNNSLNGGSIGFALYTDSNTTISLSDNSSWLSSQTITSGQIPTIATAPYLTIFTTMSITSSTQAPQVDDLSINWNEGAAGFPVASLFFEGDYLCAVSTKSVSYNDTILVYDRNNRWTMYTGLYPYSMAIYNQQAYYGDAITGNIYRFQIDDLYEDNGSAIGSYWKSKEFDFGYPVTQKYMKAYTPIAKYSANSTLDFSYGKDRGSHTSVSLDLDSVSGFYYRVIKPTSLTYQIGFSHSFSIANSVLDEHFDLLSVTLWPRLEAPLVP